MTAVGGRRTASRKGVSNLSGDLSGLMFGRLEVICQVPSKRRKMWACVCSCGVKKIVREDHLKSGASKSCGCYSLDQTINRSYKHGLAKTPEYICYHDMLKRCYSYKNKLYKYYGKRGISVCDRWRFGDGKLTGVECFVLDMGKRPTSKHSLDRINNDGNYELGNCRWATIDIQCSNRRSNLMVNYKGQKVTLKQAVKLAGNLVDYRVAHGRYTYKKWDIEKAVETPVEEKYA